MQLCRFQTKENAPPTNATGLFWATATFDWGNDLVSNVAASPVSLAVIRVSLAALVTIYLLLFLAAVFLLWIFGEWNRRRRERGLCATGCGA